MQGSKQDIRAALRQLNKLTLTDAYRAEAAQSIVQALLATEMWQKARRIGLYEALPDEPSLQSLLEAPGDKEFFIPRVEDAETIAFYSYNPEKLQEGGAFGIKEPTQARECCRPHAPRPNHRAGSGLYSPRGAPRAWESLLRSLPTKSPSSAVDRSYFPLSFTTKSAE